MQCPNVVEALTPRTALPPLEFATPVTVSDGSTAQIIAVFCWAAASRRRAEIHMFLGARFGQWYTQGRTRKGADNRPTLVTRSDD